MCSSETVVSKCRFSTGSHPKSKIYNSQDSENQGKLRKARELNDESHKKIWEKYNWKNGISYPWIELSNENYEKQNHIKNETNESKMKMRMELYKLKWEWWFMAIDNLWNLLL